MLSKHQEIINILSKAKTDITSKEIANQLNISTRTVINYINEINKQEKLIYSSSKGYRLLAKKITSSYQNSYSDYLDRANYVIKQILIDNQTINIFDLCNDMSISYSTIKADIKKWNNTFEKYKIKFYTKNNDLLINGDENAKRRLVSKVIFEETDNNFIDFNILAKLFDKDSINILVSIIDNIANEFEIFINDYAYANIILHLLIIIERIELGNELSKSNIIEVQNCYDKKILDYLVKMIEDEFKINLNSSEQGEIFVLLKSNCNYNIDSLGDNIKTLIEKDTLDFSKFIIEEVSKTYLIDLNTTSFINQFSLHLQALKTRIHSKKFNRNPLSETIKNDCPIIYDIAIFISIIINDKYDIILSEDEIAYIAIHIGSEMDRQNKSYNKIKCVFLSSNYLNNDVRICNRIMYRLGNKIDIIKIINSPAELENLNYDLLLSNIPLNIQEDYKSLVISPILSESTLTKIEKKIIDIQFLQKKQRMKKHFQDLFDKNLFFSDISFTSKEATIHFLTSKLFDLAYVDENFESYVIKREMISSTYFKDIAIPHALNAYGYKSTIAVIVNKNGIVWDDKKVYFVLLPIVSKLDKSYFANIYEVIFNQFNNENIADLAKIITSTEDLKNYLTKL